jgi:DNA-binding CsgD family transcriptional regulator
MADTLTPRQAEVVSLLGEGYNLREVARLLNVQYCTAQQHAAAAKAKTGSGTLVQLAVWGVNHARD